MTRVQGGRHAAPRPVRRPVAAAPSRRWSARRRVVAAATMALLTVGGGVALACVPPHHDSSGGNSASGTTTSATTTSAAPTSAPTTSASAPSSSAGDKPDTPPAGPSSSGSTAAAALGWGTPVARESDEYNGSSVDLGKWGLFGAGSDVHACSPGYSGNGQRCGSQTTESGGLLRVAGSADGRTGGLYSVHGGFRYGRVEVRERAVPIGASGEPYHAVPLLFPTSQDYTRGEIDFDERDVGAQSTELFVHHDGRQNECSAKVDTTAWHNYAIDWSPSSVTWFIDGAKVCTVAARVPTFDSSNGGAQMDMFAPTGTRMQSAVQQVDWFRFYKRSDTQFD